MFAEKVYMYLSGCVSVDEKYGAQQAEKEEKRKRNKDKKKKRRKKQRRVMDGLLWEIGREEPEKHNHHVPSDRNLKKFKYTAFGREESGLS